MVEGYDEMNDGDVCRFNDEGKEEDEDTDNDGGVSVSCPNASIPILILITTFLYLLTNVQQEIMIITSS